MNFTKETLETIKTHLNDYLEETGRPTKKLFRCVSVEHNDSDPSMSYDPKRNMIKCFGCNKSYDIFSLYALDNNLDSKADFKEIVNILADRYGITTKKEDSENTKKTEQKKESIKKEDFSKYYKEVRKNIDKTDYLEKRGISKKLIEKYGIGYDTKTNEVIIPVSKNFYVGRYATNNPTIKHHKPKGAMQELFNAHYLKESDFKSVVFITESIIDSLSLEEANENIKSVALNGAEYYTEAVKEMKENNFKGIVVLALDTDTTGIRVSEKMEEELEDIGIKAVKMNSSRDRYGEGRKDINEYLLADKDSLTKTITYFNDSLETLQKQKALKTLDTINAYEYFKEFEENIIDKEHNKPIPTGIEQLDNVLRGGFFKGQLVVLGAVSSLGKSTIALNIAENVASNDNNVLYFSLEMSKQELIARSLSKTMYMEAEEQNKAKYLVLDNYDILEGKGFNEEAVNGKEIVSLYQDATKKYKDTIAKNLYIEELDGTKTIDINYIEEAIKNYINITESKPLVIIDYLQIITTEKSYSDKNNIDNLVVAIKRIARQYQIPIFLISSFNRENYLNDASFSSFKESGSIEYTADILLALQYEYLFKCKDNLDTRKEKVDDMNEQEEADLMLKMLKNRNGRRKNVKHIRFYRKYSYMKFRKYDDNFTPFKD